MSRFQLTENRIEIFDALWEQLKNQIYLGTDAFVAIMQAKQAQGQRKLTKEE